MWNSSQPSKNIFLLGELFLGGKTGFVWWANIIGEGKLFCWTSIFWVGIFWWANIIGGKQFLVGNFFWSGKTLLVGNSFLVGHIFFGWEKDFWWANIVGWEQLFSLNFFWSGEKVFFGGKKVFGG